MKLYGKNYKLVWEDHFDKGTIDPGWWDVMHYNVPGWFDRPAWRKRENCTIEGSNLVIRAKIEENGDYSSGMLCGNGHLAYKYGYAEIRAKLPTSGKGIWPGFWMGRPSYNGNPPAKPEVDVFEMFGNDTYIECCLHSWWPDSVYNKYRHISYFGGNGINNRISPADGTRFSDGFHTIGYEWTPEFAAFYLDGEPYYTVKIDDEFMKVFHEPIYFIISMAFGLVHLPAPEEDRTEPIEYTIDYIRLYQNEDGKLYHVNADNELCEIDDPYSLSEL